VKRRHISVAGSATLVALLATMTQLPANAAPPADGGPERASSTTLAAKAKQDNRPDRLSEAKIAEKNEAIEKVLAGRAEVEQHKGSQAVKVAPGQWVEYGVQKSDQLLSFLVEFGENKDTRFPDAPAGPSAGAIPEPDRSKDNSTYWSPSFDRKHYLDMFFNGMPEQGGESFKGIYKEMSSGRYEVNGDVGDWVTVPNNEASYGQTESQADMTRFIQDTANAWYADQIAQGKTPAQVVDYLKTFDKWDRYDLDGDNDFDEPDGYIDHFQAIHAGEGEEAGAPEWAIWSHRWAVNQGGYGKQGPAGYPKAGGIKIGDTDLWIRDYTTEPENGGLGVFAHEYAHDLGLPDFYDTSGGENSTAFWTLMSSGSWLSHGDGAIGTTPNHMGPWEKLYLGWLDYEVARAGVSSEHELGPAYHATKKAQALITVLPEYTSTAPMAGTPAEGQDYFYSGRGDNRVATLTSPTFTVDGNLSAKVNYEIEIDWDYAYAEISTDGGQSFTPLATNLSTNTDPHGQNDGNGITGSSAGAWKDLTADLAAYQGQQAQIRFRMYNDAGYNELGFKVDDIKVGSTLAEGAEDGATGWTLDKFLIVEDGTLVTGPFAHYYIAENRTYDGYDETLKTGPYNFGWAGTAADKVEHFPYQDGLLVWYWNTQYADNNVKQHPGAGEVLPVDARGAALKWSDGVVARNRIQAFDSTFGLERTDPLSLHREVVGTDGKVTSTTLRVPARAPQPVFDDTLGSQYYDAANPGGSVKVPNTGTQIKVVGTTTNGTMKVEVY
jgi:immune inhibitor A